jgi:HAD superfamily hydrolase (TIGR01509 family)
MSRLQAILWDVDGTLAETERDGHRTAFNRAFQTLGLPWRWDEQRYGELLAVTGGRERLLADMATHGDAPATADEREALARELHRRKNRFFAELVLGGQVPLRPGVRDLMDECSARGVRLGLVASTSRVNADALLQVHLGPQWPQRFAAIVCGDDVQRKKPDPEGYLSALRTLDIGPLEAVAIEDSPSGVAAARAADIPVVVPLSAYFADATIEGAVAIGPGLHTRAGWRPALRPDPAGDGPVRLDDLQHWCSEMDTVSQFN